MPVPGVTIWLRFIAGLQPNLTNSHAASGFFEPAEIAKPKPALSEARCLVFDPPTGICVTSHLLMICDTFGSSALTPRSVQNSIIAALPERNAGRPCSKPVSSEVGKA